MFDTAMRSSVKTDSVLLRLKLIGGMQALTLSGESVLPVGGKTRGLLAVIALSDRRPLARSTLARLLWSQRPDDLARASLRQEIHRLLEAFSPLGVPVIDVQRHSLTLKSVLTSVDVEQLLNGGTEILSRLPPISDVLLSELNGIDPAFDEWLERQRMKLQRHIFAQFEKALRSLTDPDAILTTANNFLRRDKLNEMAWRARIQAWALKGEYAQATMASEQVMQLFQESVGTPPSPATMRLIREIQNRTGAPSGIASTGAHDGGHEMTSTVKNNSEIGTSFSHLSGSSSLERFVSHRYLGRIAVAPFKAGGGRQAEALSASFAERLEVKLVNLQTFVVVPFPEGNLRADEVRCDRPFLPEVDFLITGVVREAHEAEDGAKGYVIIRLLNLRQDGCVIWADRFAFPTDQTAQRSLLFYVLVAVQWALVVAQGRRVLSRPIAELTAVQLASRALTLLLRCDRSRFAEIDNLIKRAQLVDPESVFVLYTQVLSEFIHALENWGAYSIEELEAIASHASSVTVHLRANPIGIWLSMFIKTFVPGQISEAKALVCEFCGEDGPFPTVPMSPLMLGLSACHSLIANDRERAIAEVQQFRLLRTNHPASVLLEPLSILVLNMCNCGEEARRAGAAFTSLYPRSGAGILYHLITLCDSAPYAEFDRLKQHFLRLVPEATITAIIARHAYLPDDMRYRMQEKLERIGLPFG